MKRVIDHLTTRFQVDVKRYPPRGHGLPAHLDLEQQGLFVLGYHHMRHWLRMNGEERAKWEEAHSGAPPAYRWGKREEREAEAEPLAGVSG